MVGSMHHASRGELTSTVWIGGEIGLPSQKRQRVVTMAGLGVGLQDDDALPWGKGVCDFFKTFKNSLLRMRRPVEAKP